MSKTHFILVIPDTHDPFTHPKRDKFLGVLKREFRPEHVVHLGDMFDFASAGRWEKDPDGYSQCAEIEAGRESIKTMIELFPRMRICFGNHDLRVNKDAFRSGISNKWVRDMREIMSLPKNWQWNMAWTIDNINFEHGDGFSGPQGALNAAKQRRMSTVIGHLHTTPGVLYSNNGRNTIWGMNAGSLINQEAYCFKYAAGSKEKACAGAGVVEIHPSGLSVPQWIPLDSVV